MEGFKFVCGKVNYVEYKAPICAIEGKATFMISNVLECAMIKD